MTHIMSLKRQRHIESRKHSSGLQGNFKRKRNTYFDTKLKRNNYKVFTIVFQLFHTERYYYQAKLLHCQISKQWLISLLYFFLLKYVHTCKTKTINVSMLRRKFIRVRFIVQSHPYKYTHIEICANTWQIKTLSTGSLCV